MSPISDRLLPSVLIAVGFLVACYFGAQIQVP